MLEQLADSAALAWPLALTCASVVAAGRVRSRRRRERLNRRLHELRRPLQALSLAVSQPPSARWPGGQLELALAALGDLDREINGAGPSQPPRPVEARELAEDAVARWRRSAVLRGRRLDLAWSANGTKLMCEPAAIARALDNLIANALEHGSGPIRLEATVRARRLRLLVADGADAGGPPASRRGEVEARFHGSRSADPRHGHGLRVVAEVAAEHGGRFAACRHAAGASAVLELPLTE